MPAPAVIPAPIAYIKVVAVKTLVVGFRGLCSDGLLGTVCTALPASHLAIGVHLALTGWVALLASFTMSKLECSKQAFRLEYFSMG